MRKGERKREIRRRRVARLKRHRRFLEELLRDGKSYEQTGWMTGWLSRPAPLGADDPAMD